MSPTCVRLAGLGARSHAGRPSDGKRSLLDDGGGASVKKTIWEMVFRQVRYMLGAYGEADG